MPRNIKGIKIFVGSAGGLDSLRNEFREIIEQYNRLEALPLDVHFTAVGWEDTLPSSRQRGQAEINEQLRGCDYALFLFRDRWGTPPNIAGATPAYSSGTEEEYAVAGECINAKTMLDRSVFFLPVPAKQANDPGDQLKAVLTFKQRLIDEKNCLFQHLNDDAQFGEFLRGLLGQWRRTHEPRSATGAARDTTDRRIGALSEAASLTLPNVPASSTTANTDRAFDQVASALKKSLEEEDFAGALALATVARELVTQPANIAWAMFAHGVMLGQLERYADEIAQYDELIARFAAASEPSLREHVADAMFNKGAALAQLERYGEAMAQCDELIARFAAASEPALRENVAGAMLNRGVSLDQLERRAEAMAQYEKLIARFAVANEPELLKHVAGAMFNKGLMLNQLERYAEEIAQYDELIARFAEASEPVLRQHVAKAMFNKGVSLGVLGRSAEEITQYDALIARFGAASEPALREQVSMAMFNRGVSLGVLDHSAEEITQYDELIARFAAASEPALKDLVTKARRGKEILNEQNAKKTKPRKTRRKR